MEITCDSSRDKLNVYIDGILHLALTIYDLQLQSWKKSKSSYWIEFTTKTGVITCEYNSLEKWKRILELIDDEL
jgi:hypothetical protein